MPVLHPMELLHSRSWEEGEWPWRLAESRQPAVGAYEVLADDALEFVAELHRRFDGRRRELLDKRRERQRALDEGGTLDFLAETREIREGDWQVAPPPADLQKRWVEITGPTDRKMVINALNSGATGFMADFEDSNSPTWSNMIEGQVNLTRRDRGHDQLEQGRQALRARRGTATLLVRPRGWHLTDKHCSSTASASPARCSTSASTSSATRSGCSRRGSGPYFYLPKMESHLEARLWNDVFMFAQEQLGIPHGT